MFSELGGSRKIDKKAIIIKTKIKKGLRNKDRGITGARWQ